MRWKAVNEYFEGEIRILAWEKAMVYEARPEDVPFLPLESLCSFLNEATLLYDNASRRFDES